MTDGPGDVGGQEELPAPTPSPRVDLEAAVLASEPLAEASTPDSEPARARLVMIIAIDPDTRYYVRECLLARPHVRVIEVPALALAEQVAMRVRPDLFIVDRVSSDRLPPGPVIVLADERPPLIGQSSGDRPEAQTWLARPFNAGSLVSLVDRMLAAWPTPSRPSKD